MVNLKMSNRHRKRSSLSLIVRKIQVKTTVPSVRMTDFIAVRMLYKTQETI